MKLRQVAACASALILVSTFGTVTAAHGDTEEAADGQFTLSALDSGDLSASDVSSDSSMVILSDDGDGAVGDLTMAEAADRGHRAMYGATASFVDLSWDEVSDATSYVVSRSDGVSYSTSATDLRDQAVSPSTNYVYTIQPVAPAADAAASIPAWGLNVTTPSIAASSSATALKRSLATKSKMRSASATPMSVPGGGGGDTRTTVDFKTFIAAQYVNAPPTGCDYSGSSYQYGGDNRSYSTSSTAYRTRMKTTIDWDNSGHASSSAATGVTHVYKKSDHSLVSKKQASASTLHIKTLSASSKETDLRFDWNSTNPFCHFGGIEGAFTIEITASGNWTLISGSHRDMPYYEIYIERNGVYTTVYRRSGSDPFCLINACEQVNMGGRAGSY